MLFTKYLNRGEAAIIRQAHDNGAIQLTSGQRRCLNGIIHRKTINHHETQILNGATNGNGRNSGRRSGGRSNRNVRNGREDVGLIQRIKNFVSAVINFIKLLLTILIIIAMLYIVFVIWEEYTYLTS